MPVTRPIPTSVIKIVRMIFGQPLSGYRSIGVSPGIKYGIKPNPPIK